MADTKISALPAVTTPASTDEFAINQTGTSKKATLAQIMGSGVIIGTPMTPTVSCTLLDGWEATITTRFTLGDGLRLTLQGTSDFEVADDFAKRSRIVLAGRG